MFNHSIKGMPLDKGPYIRKTEVIPSRGNGCGVALKPVESVKYTGTAMLGVATMHKSNAVPVFNTEAAKDVATMRRN